jgi:hypothetical protein
MKISKLKATVLMVSIFFVGIPMGCNDDDDSVSMDGSVEITIPLKRG